MVWQINKCSVHVSMRKRERKRAYILTTWQPLVLGILQLHLTALSEFLTHTDCALHGSTLKFQSVFPKVFAISRKACSVQRYHHKKKKKKKRKKSKVKKKIKSIILVNIFYQIWVPFHTHGNNNFIENRKEKKKKKKKLKLSYTQLCVREWEWEHTFIIYQCSGSNNKTCEAKGDSWSKEKSNEEHLEFFG